MLSVAAEHEHVLQQRLLNLLPLELRFPRSPFSDKLIRA